MLKKPAGSRPVCSIFYFPSPPTVKAAQQAGQSLVSTDRGRNRGAVSASRSAGNKQPQRALRDGGSEAPGPGGGPRARLQPLRTRRGRLPAATRRSRNTARAPSNSPRRSSSRSRTALVYCAACSISSAVSFTIVSQPADPHPQDWPAPPARAASQSAPRLTTRQHQSEPGAARPPG